LTKQLWANTLVGEAYFASPDHIFGFRLRTSGGLEKKTWNRRGYSRQLWFGPRKQPSGRGILKLL